MEPSKRETPSPRAHARPPSAARSLRLARVRPPPPAPPTHAAPRVSVGVGRAVVQPFGFDGAQGAVERRRGAHAVPAPADVWQSLGGHRQVLARADRQRHQEPLELRPAARLQRIPPTGRERRDAVGLRGWSRAATAGGPTDAERCAFAAQSDAPHCSGGGPPELGALPTGKHGARTRSTGQYGARTRSNTLERIPRTRPATRDRLSHEGRRPQAQRRAVGRREIAASEFSRLGVASAACQPSVYMHALSLHMCPLTRSITPPHACARSCCVRPIRNRRSPRPSASR